MKCKYDKLKIEKIKNSQNILKMLKSHYSIDDKLKIEKIKNSQNIVKMRNLIIVSMINSK